MRTDLLNPDEPLPAQTRPGVTLGYVAAGILAGGLWLGVGFMLVPLMLLLAPAHWLAARASENSAIDTGNAHHRWLARHHLFSVALLVFVVFGPLLAVPALISDTTTVANTLAQAPHPFATLRAAWPQLHVATLLGATLLALVGWLIASFWITLRLIRRWLRWADGAPP